MTFEQEVWDVMVATYHDLCTACGGWFKENDAHWSEPCGPPDPST